jgi:acetyl-CoA carboxylase biotin carboxyl carrier protein
MEPVDNDDIEWLISLLLAEGLTELEVNEHDRGVLVRRAAAPRDEAGPAPSPPLAQTDEDAHGLVAVRAPMAGVFYRSSAPDSHPFVEDGDDVQVGETVGLVEAMKLYNDIEAPCSGRVRGIVAADAARVTADQELMYIKPFGE